MNAQVDAIVASNPAAAVRGLLCADANGLCVTAKGELSMNSSGRYTAIARQAAALQVLDGSGSSGSRPATVLIETRTRATLVKAFDAMTVVLRSDAAALSER